jgi:hypothetical protein
MAATADRLKFLSNDVRADVAALCREEPRTRDELALLLDRPSGGLTAPDTMKKHGVLKAAGRRPSGGERPGGELLVFDESWAAALDSVLSQRSAGEIREGVDLILVTASTALRACEVLSDERLSVRWGTVLAGGQMGLLISPSSRPDDDAASLRLLEAFHKAGADALRLRIGAVLPESELRRWAQRVSGSSAHELPPADGDN